jgi:hypothetical protein
MVQTKEAKRTARQRVVLFSFHVFTIHKKKYNIFKKTQFVLKKIVHLHTLKKTSRKGG